MWVGRFLLRRTFYYPAFMILRREIKPSTLGHERRMPSVRSLALSATLVVLLAVTLFSAVSSRREESSLVHCVTTEDVARPAPTTSSSLLSPFTRVPPLDIGRKKGSRVIVNIGSNKRPIGPRQYVMVLSWL